MSKFQLPETLPVTVAELDALANKAQTAINAIQSKAQAHAEGVGEEPTQADVEALEELTKAYKTVDAERTKVVDAEQGHADRLASALDEAKAATAPKPAPVAETPAAPAEPETAAEPDPAEVVAEAEQATQAAAEEPQVVTASTPAPVSFAGAAPSDTPKPDADEPHLPFLLASTASNFAEHDGKPVDTSAIAAAIVGNGGEFTGLSTTAPTVLATMARPQGREIKSYGEFLEERARVTTEIPGHGPVSAKAMVAAGGWCSPSERVYAFEPTQPALGLLSFPEMHFKRGGIIIPDEPDFSSLQTGFHFTESQLQATDGGGEPTAIKSIVEVPCPPNTIEYRLEAIGWGVKAGVLQQRAYPEAVKKFLDEFLVEHQYRISAKSLLKVLALSSAAKVVPNDVVLGATTGILNGLHFRAQNIQLKTRKKTIEGIAPYWFRSVLRADLASRDGLDVLNVTDGDVDRWLADRDIYLQYEGRWQSLGAGQPGNYDTSWWPGSVDVVLYPAGTFWRVLDNVLKVGAMYDIDMLQKNRELVGFIEDEFQVGKTAADPSHLIRIPLCVNGAVGARESIDCSAEYASTVTQTLTVTGTPTGGTIPVTFSGLGGKTASVVFNSTNAQAKTALGAMDDNIAASAFTVTGGALPGTALVITYPASLGTMTAVATSLTGGTSPTVVVS